jgi:phage terminase large subunit GpA-like protein
MNNNKFPKMDTPAPNPLKRFSRTPKIYVKLPSEHMFYPPDFIVTSPNGEVPIKAMTATDDLIMNNPDALLNGDAVMRVIQNCTEGCIDVGSLLIPDVETILLGIRYASQGDNMKFNTKCPHCGTESQENVSIRTLLDNSTYISTCEETTVLSIDTGDGSRVDINIHPSPYKDNTNANMVMYEQTRILQFVSANKELPEDARKEKMRKSFDLMAEFQLGVLINSVESVDIIQISEGGEEFVTKVTDKNHIREFIVDLDKDNAKILERKLEKLNKIGVPRQLEVICDSCSKSHTMEVRFDPVNFSADTF